MTEKIENELKQIEYNLTNTKFNGKIGEQLKKAFIKRRQDIIRIINAK